MFRAVAEFYASDNGAAKFVQNFVKARNYAGFFNAGFGGY